MSREILEAVEKGNQAFADFKKINDARLEALEKGASGADQKAAMEKAFAAMDEVKTKMEDLEAKMKRPGFGQSQEQKEDAAQVEHKEAFKGYMQKGREFDLSIEQKALQVAANGDGGYAVPKTIETMIESLVVNVSPMRQIASVVSIGTPDYHKLVNVRGTSSGWVGETAARPATNTPTLADIKPPMGELYANPQATQQMLDDVFFDAESWLADNLATEFARAEGAAFLVGTGTNQPMGLLSGTMAATDDATRTFGQLQYVPTGVAGDWAASNKADVLFTLVGKLKAAYRQNAGFLTCKATLFELAAFKDANGRYLFDFSTVPGKPSTLLGYGVTEAEDMPGKAANALGLAFGDFKRGYTIVDRVGTRVVRDPFTNKPYIGFYTTKRVGGAVINSEAVKVLKFSVS